MARCACKIIYMIFVRSFAHSPGYPDLSLFFTRFTFCFSESRTSLLPMIVNIIHSYLSERYKIQQCAEILGDILQVLFNEQSQVGTPCLPKRFEQKGNVKFIGRFRPNNVAVAHRSTHVCLFVAPPVHFVLGTRAKNKT